MARDLFEYHPTIGYRFIPDLVARVRHEGGGYLVEANNLGFRNSRPITNERNGRPRILVFGDSYTAGDGVSNAYRYTDRLQRVLPEVEIVNFGLPGSGTDQQYLVWQQYGRSIECDLIVIAPMVENIVRNMQDSRHTMSAANGRLVRRAKPWFELDDSQPTGLKLHNHPVPRVAKEVQDETSSRQETSTSFLKRMNQAIDRKVPGFRPMTQRIRGISWPPEYNHPDDQAWLLMKTILKNWIRQSQAPTLLFPIPTFGHIEGGIDAKPYQRRFNELANELQVSLTDPLDAFMAHPLAYRRDCRFVLDEHPNAQGHDVLAQALLPAVRASLSVRESA